MAAGREGSEVTESSMSKSGSLEQHSLTCKLDSRLATDGGCPSRKAVPTDARVDAGEEEILTGRATPGEGPTGGRLSFQRGI